MPACRFAAATECFGEHGSDESSAASVVTARSLDDGSDPGLFEAEKDLADKCGQEHSNNNGKGKQIRAEPYCAKSVAAQMVRMVRQKRPRWP